jgi:signal transduction histidine kinase
MRDRLIAGALLLAAWGEQISGGREQLWWHLGLAALMTLPLGFARRRPWVPAVAAGAGLVIYGALGSEPDATGEIFAMAGAAFLLGSRLALRPALAWLGGLAAAAAVHLALLKSLGDILFVAGAFLVPAFLLGVGMRGRRLRIGELEGLNRRLAEERERSASLAAELERTRISRDLEAVVAASLDVMVEQARHGETLDDPEAAAAAFEVIRATGAEATAELRRLLRLMH